MQGILISLFAIFMLNRSYNNHWNKYLKTDHHALNIFKVYLRSINIILKRLCMMIVLEKI